MDKLLELSLLFDIYSPLLTKTQRNVFENYHHEDLSLNEVAQINGISKQAVSENLRRAEANLYDFESKMHLFEKNAKILSFLQKIFDYEESQDKKEEDLQEIFQEARSLNQRM